MNLAIEEEKILTGHNAAVSNVSLLSDSERLISASEKGIVRLWRIADSKSLLSRRLHSAPINDLGVSSNEDRVATVSSDNTFSVWKISGGPAVPVPQALDASGHCLAYLRNSMIAVGLSNGSIEFWDSDGSSAPYALQAHADTVNDITSSPDGNFLVSVSANSEIKMWNLQTLEIFQKFLTLGDSIKCIDFSRDNCSLATGDEKGSAQLWQIPSRNPIVSLEVCEAPIADIKFHPSGLLLLILDSTGFLHIWDISSGNRIAEIEVCMEGADSISIGSDGRLIAAGCRDSTVRLLALWPEEGQKEGHLERHISWACRYCFAPLTVGEVEILKSGQPTACCYCGRTLTFDLYQ